MSQSPWPGSQLLSSWFVPHSPSPSQNVKYPETACAKFQISSHLGKSGLAGQLGSACESGVRQLW